LGKQRGRIPPDLSPAASANVLLHLQYKAWEREGGIGGGILLPEAMDILFHRDGTGREESRKGNVDPRVGISIIAVPRQRKGKRGAAEDALPLGRFSGSGRKPSWARGARTPKKEKGGKLRVALMRASFQLSLSFAKSVGEGEKRGGEKKGKSGRTARALSLACIPLFDKEREKKREEEEESEWRGGIIIGLSSSKFIST